MGPSEPLITVTFVFLLFILNIFTIINVMPAVIKMALINFFTVHFLLIAFLLYHILPNKLGLSTYGENSSHFLVLRFVSKKTESTYSYYSEAATNSK